MTGKLNRSALKALVSTNLPSGTGAITAADHRELVNSIIDSIPVFSDVLIRVENITTTAPPSTPTDGDAYIIAAGATGDWAGKDHQIAIWDGSVSPSDWFYIVPENGSEARDLSDNSLYVYDDTVSPTVWTLQSASGAGSATESLIIAVSDETSVLSAGTSKVTFRMPYAFTLTAVRASLTTAATGGTVTVDINEGGVSILSTKLTIDAGEKTSTSAAAAAVISDAALANDAEITIDIDDDGTDAGVSPTEAGTATGLKVYLVGVQP